MTPQPVPTTPLQPWIAAKIGLPGPDLDPVALRRYQLERIGATLRLARGRSPFYRALLTGLPDAPDTLGQLAGYPFTTPADLARYGPRLVCADQDEVARVVTQEQPADLPAGWATLDTSGTAGPPKRVWFTSTDQALTVDFFAVGMSTFTAAGDSAVVLLPCERPGSVGDLLATALERLGARPVRHSVLRDVGYSLAELRQAGADVMVGIPAQVLALARADAGRAPRARLRPRSVLLSTDHVPDALARAVEQIWDCRVFNHYGMTEMGLGGGVECEARRGYHLREADLYVEIVDPGGGAPVPDGEPGEVVFTTLTRTGMPLIRYRTGDLSRFVPGPCPCGTTLRTLERITRRTAGVVRTTTGAPLALADLDEVLFALPGVVDFDAALVRSGGGRDRLDVELRVSGPGGTASAQAVRALHRLTGSPAGDQLAVSVRVVTATAPPAAAKRRLTVVDRDA
ncbi:MAG TPA: AMP-binding protein [Kineosporiaceae bacterium]|nr:AMP-binding protein [Kineosporiaceae bacterium]